jgi:protein TonB
MTGTQFRHVIGRAPGAVLRFAVCGALALLVAALLFLLDTRLVALTPKTDARLAAVRLAEFVRVAQIDDVRVRERRLPRKPAPPDRPPPPRRLDTGAPTEKPMVQIDFQMPDVEIGLGNGDGPWLGAYGMAAAPGGSDSEVMPIARIEPQYPREALLRGIEGWVKVEFLIMGDGSVAEVRVVGSDPPRIFDRNAVRAVQRWKYRPRYENGRAVERRGAQVIEFRLDDADTLLSAVSDDTPPG